MLGLIIRIVQNWQFQAVAAAPRQSFPVIYEVVHGLKTPYALSVAVVKDVAYMLQLQLYLQSLP